MYIQMYIHQKRTSLTCVQTCTCNYMYLGAYVHRIKLTHPKRKRSVDCAGILCQLPDPHDLYSIPVALQTQKIDILYMHNSNTVHVTLGQQKHMHDNCKFYIPMQCRRQTFWITHQFTLISITVSTCTYMYMYTYGQCAY